MAGRKPGTKNKNHTERTEQVTLKISPTLKREWKAFCAGMGIKMSDRLETLVTQDMQQVAGAYGEETGQK